ncbi:MAG: aldehyde dehydrogenase family protein, partial [Saprospiraceae bacterium]
IIVQLFADLLKQNIESLASTLTAEMGKPLQQSRNEINGAAHRVGWLAQHTSKYISEEVMTLDDHLIEKIVYEPLGVICNISAWNYPYNVGVNVFIPALLAGNAVMYKPSEYSVLTGLKIEQYLKQAGVPDEVFQVAIGGGEVGNQLLDLPFNGYYFTGSFKTGKHIYERVSTKMVPCQLELGGKDPVYITEDIEDIKLAAASVADGAFYNNGQSCCAIERIYVHELIYDAFIKEFVDEVKSWKIGSPDIIGTYISVLSRPSQVAYLEDQVNDAIAKGAHVLTGGKRISSKGYYFEPTVLVNVNHTMNLMKEESFGPVIGIMKVDNDEEAIRLMNDTEYGLTAAVYSKSLQRAQRVFDQMNTGTVYWNCCDRVSPSVPWSGRKHSGFGSTLSHQGLRAFTQPKAYHLRS